MAVLYGLFLNTGQIGSRKPPKLPNEVYVREPCRVSVGFFVGTYTCHFIKML